MKKYILPIILMSCVMSLVSCKPETIIKEIEVPVEKKESESKKHPLVGYWVGSNESLVLREDGTATVVIGNNAYEGNWTEKDGILNIEYTRTPTRVMFALDSSYQIEGHMIVWHDPYTGKTRRLYSTT